LYIQLYFAVKTTVAKKTKVVVVVLFVHGLIVPDSTLDGFTLLHLNDT